MEACLYEGRLTHVRRAPAHRFEMALFALFADIGELDATLGNRWLCSASHPAPLRIRRRDYPGDPAQPLDGAIRDLVERELGGRPSGPIGLLTQPRTFGYGFNPVSFFYCFDASGRRVETVVAHVRNTPWHEKHCYVLAPDDPGAKTFHARRAKAFHVSPFMPMNLDHEFILTSPGERVSVRVANVSGAERPFEAVLVMTRRPLTSASLARIVFRYPLQSLLVTARIYWEAFRLYRKGAPYFPHPGPPVASQSKSR